MDSVKTLVENGKYRYLLQIVNLWNSPVNRINTLKMHERGSFYITTGMERYVGIYKQIYLLNNNLIHHSLSVGWYPNSILMHVLNKLLIRQRVGRREITAVFIACIVLQQLGRGASADRERSLEFLRLQQHSQSKTVEVRANNLPVKPTLHPCNLLDHHSSQQLQ